MVSARTALQLYRVSVRECDPDVDQLHLQMQEITAQCGRGWLGRHPERRDFSLDLGARMSLDLQRGRAFQGRGTEAGVGRACTDSWTRKDATERPSSGVRLQAVPEDGAAGRSSGSVVTDQGSTPGVLFGGERRWACEGKVKSCMCHTDRLW